MDPNSTNAATGTTTALTVVPQMITTVNALNAQQIDVVTLERTMEVHRIATEQELKRQLEQQKLLVSRVAEEHRVLRKALEDKITVRAAQQVRGSAAMKGLSKALTDVFGLKITAAGLVESVSLAHLDESKDYYSSDGIYAGIEVMSTVKPKVLWRTAEASEAPIESDGEEDHCGRPVATVNGWFTTVKLTAAERKDLRMMRVAWAELTLQSDNKLELERRLKAVAEQTEALKGQILRKQIEQTPGGQAILQMLDDSLQATINGDFTRLL